MSGELLPFRQPMKPEAPILGGMLIKHVHVVGHQVPLYYLPLGAGDLNNHH